MKRGNFISSFNYAVQGIISSIRTERNMKIHYLAAIAVIVGSLFFNLTRVEFMLLFFAVTFVLTSELINTAIERTVDLVTQSYNPVAKLAKDIAAGAVLIASLNALVVGYLIFFDRLNTGTELLVFKLRSSNPHLAFVAVFLVIVLVVAGKLLWMHRSGGTVFQGGAVSGHTALAFCMATIISLIVVKGLVIGLAYFIAFLVAQSRVEGKIHKVSEVVLGALVGSLVAFIIYRLVGYYG